MRLACCRPWRWVAFTVAAWGLALTPFAAAQTTLNEQLRKVLTDPDAMKEMEKTKNLAPVELFKTQVLPNDVLPWVKPNQWVTLGINLRSNQIDYSGTLQTSPIHIEGMPQDVVFDRDARLPKGMRTRVTLPVMLSRIPREIGLSLRRPDMIRDDELWNIPLRVLEPHQMLIPVLTKGPNDGYNRINALRVMVPTSAAHGDQILVDRQRYYRLVLPEDPSKPLLPNHPLAWTAISHIIWDGMDPEILSVGQQEAMIDWIHWGGQLVIVGGAGPAFNPLKQSFLGPYLPADPNGNNALLTSDDLAAFSREYHATAGPKDPEDLLEGTQSFLQAWSKFGMRYQPNPSLIKLEKDKPVYLTGLTPKPGASAISLGRASLPPIAVESRVGRGRIVMIGLNLLEPSFTAWPGFETFIRRVVLRRPEESMAEMLRYAPNGGGFYPPRYNFLHGPSLTWIRLHSRDLGAGTRRLTTDDELDTGRRSARQTGTTSSPYNTIDYYQVPVAEWNDTSALPALSRRTLEQASGIEIPDSRFVLTVILAYLICLVPINWAICRYGFGRREWAWVLVPVLSLGFAVVVERAAAFDVGYENTVDEIDMLETHGDYGHAHVSRFGSIYSTGRAPFSISFPDDPTALVLPMSTGRSIRGEDVHEAKFQGVPHPALTEYLVQPRSLAMFRAEQMASVPGTVRLVTENGVRKVVNDGPFELKNAILIDLKRPGSEGLSLGSIPSKATLEVKGEPFPVKDYVAPAELPAAGEKNTLSPKSFLELLVASSEVNGPEDEGEVRLIAWTDKVLPGEVIEPSLDRHRGFTLFVAHLKPGNLPNPDAPEYDALALGPERPPIVVPPAPQPNPAFTRMGMGRIPPGAAVPGITAGALPKPKVAPPPGAMPTPKPKKKAEPGDTDPTSEAPTPNENDDPNDDGSSETPRR